VDALLKEMENHEARLPEAERFDFSRLAPPSAFAREDVSEQPCRRGMERDGGR
jgi:hypothetical protein